jgi:thioesterase DpgC
MPDVPTVEALAAAGLDPAAVAAWAEGAPAPAGTLAADGPRFSAFWARSDQLLAGLPAKPERHAGQGRAAGLILAASRSARERFLAAHVEAVCDRAAGGRLLRVGALVEAASRVVPGLLPTAEQTAGEASRDLAAKEGREVDQGIFLAHVLARPRLGLDLCHAMLLPMPGSTELAERLAADGALDLGPARLVRRGRAVHLTAGNPRVLNAEDDTTLAAMEAAVDVAILDGASEIAVLRGAAVEHAKYAGRRVFGAGINLTRLYRGRIPFLWYLERDLGYVHKLLRGLARPDVPPDDVAGPGIEKPWIAAVDAFAIGGHCQLLLCMDFVVAASDAVLTLPARKEGIIPGLANLRLPRFVGDRIARQAIQHGRVLAAASPEGRLVCDEVVAPEEMDAAVERAVAGLTGSGVVGALGNRRALRVGAEPLDLFRRYCAVYAREQAHCHVSPALIDNLERHWGAASRRM